MIKFLITAVLIYLVYLTIRPPKPPPEIRKPHGEDSNFTQNIEGEYVDYEEVDD
jgi:hypothetical protein